MPAASKGYVAHWTPKEIRKRLVDADLTIAQFAEHVGLSVGQMSSILNGHRKLSRIEDLRITEVLRQLNVA